MEAFELRIVPNTQLISIALSAVEEYSKIFFVDTNSINQIRLAVEEAFNNIIAYSLSNTIGNIKLTAEAENGEFIVRIYDKGIPGNFEERLSGDDKLGLTIMQNFMDVVAMENLGSEGRCQKLVKYYSSKTNFELMPKLEDTEIIENATIAVRSPKKNEMLEICHRLYDEYGLTYCHEDVYYPDRFWAEIAKDQIHSVVAVDENGNIAGHHASWEWKDIPGIWESGMAVVNKSYRHCGIFNKMMNVTRDYVVNKRKANLFISTAVTTHTATQTVRLNYGDSPCGFALNASSPNGMRGTFFKYDERYSYAYAFSAFEKSERTVYLDEEVKTVAEGIYASQGLPRNIVTRDADYLEIETENSSSYTPIGANGRLCYFTLGPDSERMFKNDFLILKNQGAEMVEMFVNVENPGAIKFYRGAKKLGFFFTGIMPCTDKGDLLIMDKILSRTVNYDHIMTTGPFTDMLEVIKSFDPDQKLQ